MKAVAFHYWSYTLGGRQKLVHVTDRELYWTDMQNTRNCSPKISRRTCSDAFNVSRTICHIKTDILQ